MLHIVCFAGTGKSVTGAHMAYALAMKLKKEVQASRSRPPASPRPCVMYCGPSQQSVNVVLGKFYEPSFCKHSGCAHVAINMFYDWCSLFFASIVD